MQVIMKTIRADFEGRNKGIFCNQMLQIELLSLPLLVLVLTRQDIKIAIMGGPSNLKTLLWLEHKIDFNSNVTNYFT